VYIKAVLDQPTLCWTNFHTPTLLQPPIPEEKPPATDPYYVESPPEPEEEVDSKPSSPVTVPEPLPSSRVEDVPMSTKPSEAMIHILQYVGRDLAGQLHAPTHVA